MIRWLAATVVRRVLTAILAGRPGHRGPDDRLSRQRWGTSFPRFIIAELLSHRPRRLLAMVGEDEGAYFVTSEHLLPGMIDPGDGHALGRVALSGLLCMHEDVRVAAQEDASGPGSDRMAPLREKLSLSSRDLDAVEDYVPEPREPQVAVEPTRVAEQGAVDAAGGLPQLHGRGPPRLGQGVAADVLGFADERE